MENNYWIVDEWLIFKPDFNENLDEYYDVINKYEKVMFSNLKQAQKNLDQQHCDHL